MVRLLVLILSLAFATGCSRSVPENSFSSVSIQVPKGLNKIGSLAAMPPNQKACYGVNVSGPGIPSSRGNTCSPYTGIVGGFAEPGAVLETSVPKGRDRKIELLAYLQPVGQNLPCPKLGKSMSATQATSTFVVGTVYNVDMSSDITVVEITADFPGLTNHIAQQQSLPLTCGPNDGQNRPGFHVSGGMATASDGVYRMISRTGRPAGQQTASGGGFRMVTK